MEQISLNYTTEDASALAGTDYVAKSGVLTFTPGTSTASIDITVNSDTAIESNETFLVKFSNPVNASNSSSQVTVTIANDDSTIQFGSASYTIAEDGNSLNVTISRTGEVAGSTVEYSTTDLAGANKCDITNGAASSRCDFITTLGTFTFATGETSKSISIPIVDDVYAEGSETFTIALANAVGMTHLRPPQLLRLPITSRQTDPKSFRHSCAFRKTTLHRFSKSRAGFSWFSFWTNEITSCGSDSQCVEVRRINVSAAFFLSIEFQETGYFVYRVSKSAFGNLSGAAVPVTFKNFLKDTQEIGKGVQVGVGNWQFQLESNKQAYTLSTVQRADFLVAFPNTLTAQQFVNQMNNNAGGVLTLPQTCPIGKFPGVSSNIAIETCLSAAFHCGSLHPSSRRV